MTIICDSYSYSHKSSVRLFTPRVFATRHEHAPHPPAATPVPAAARACTRAARGGAGATVGASRIRVGVG